MVETVLKSSDDCIEPLPEYYKLMNDEEALDTEGKDLGTAFREASNLSFL